MKLKHNDKYYYQVQGVMAITKRRWCDFVVWTPKGISIERIDYDSGFWADHMLPKFLAFYNNALLPELAAPEHPNGRPIREPGTCTHTLLTFEFLWFLVRVYYAASARTLYS